MKLSMAVSTPDAKFSALALKGDYNKIFSLLRECGYDGAELAVRDPSTVDTAGLKTLLDRHGLALPAIGTGRAFGEDGLSFSSPEDTVRSAAVDRIRSHIDMAQEFGALVIIGLIVGKSERTEENESRAADCLAECARYAADRGVRLAVEPINRYETNFIITVRDCLTFLDRVGEDSCGILFDTFHANIEEASITDSIKAASERIVHVHVADSNRHFPGAGHTDFPGIIDALRDEGYDGWLSAEILPLPDPETAVRNNAAFLKDILEP